MSIARVPEEIPKKLPRACIFLDEVEAIGELLKTALANASSPDSTPPSINYTLNDKTHCDSLADLVTVGGVVKTFRLIANSTTKFSSCVSVSLDIDSSTWLWAEYLPSDVHWALYGKVRSILYARRLKVAYVFDSFSYPVQGA